MDGLSRLHVSEAGDRTKYVRPIGISLDVCNVAVDIYESTKDA